MPVRHAVRTRRSHLYWHLVFFALILALLFVVIRGLGAVLTPIAAALMVSYLLDPIVTWLEARLGWPRWLGTLTLFIVAVIILVVGLLVLVPVIVRELHTFGEAVPGYMQRIRDTVIPWVQSTFDVKVPVTLHDFTARLGDTLRGLATKAVAPLGGVAGEVAHRVGDLVSTLGTLLLIPIFTFYFLPKFPGIRQGALELIPRRYMTWVVETAREIDRVLSAWIRGQLTVIACLAVLYSLGLLFIAKIKMAVLIGILTGMLAFIPYVGVSVGLILALLMCLLEYSGPGQMLLVGLVFVTVQVFDGLFLTPYVVGEKVGLGPVGVLIALMLGGTLFGFVGVLIAVPTAAALVVVLKRGIASYKASLFYQKGGAGPTGAPRGPDPPTDSSSPRPEAEQTGQDPGSGPHDPTDSPPTPPEAHGTGPAPGPDRDAAADSPPAPADAADAAQEPKQR